jgi:hypothetical protein
MLASVEAIVAAGSDSKCYPAEQKKHVVDGEIAIDTGERFFYFEGRVLQ